MRPDEVAQRFEMVVFPQLVQKAQGHCELKAGDSVIELAWFSDLPGEWTLSIAHGEEESVVVVRSEDELLCERMAQAITESIA